MAFIEELISDVSNALYSYILIIVLVLGGLYFTVRTRFAPFRLFKDQIKSVTQKPTDGKSVSSFQALMVSTASRVGTGNCYIEQGTDIQSSCRKPADFEGNRDTGGIQCFGRMVFGQ